MARVAKCWRQNPQISLSRGVVLSQSIFHLVLYFLLFLISVLLSACSSVYLSLRSHISKITREISPNFLRMLPTCGRRTILFWWECSTLRTSGSVDNVTFSHNGGVGQDQRRRVCFAHIARWQHRGRSLPSSIASCFSCTITAESNYASPDWLAY